jgi:hypothetical protein
MSGHSRSRKRSTAQGASSHKPALAHSPQALSKGEILAATQVAGTVTYVDPVSACSRHPVRSTPRRGRSILRTQVARRRRFLHVSVAAAYARWTAVTNLGIWSA